MKLSSMFCVCVCVWPPQNIYALCIYVCMCVCQWICEPLYVMNFHHFRGQNVLLQFCVYACGQMEFYVYIVTIYLLIFMHNDIAHCVYNTYTIQSICNAINIQNNVTHHFHIWCSDWMAGTEEKCNEYKYVMSKRLGGRPGETRCRNRWKCYPKYQLAKIYGIFMQIKTIQIELNYIK